MSDVSRSRRRAGLVQVTFTRPVRQLIATGQLQLAQDGRDVALDGLGRDGQLPGDVLIGVPARDQSEYLTFACGQLVEVRVDGHDRLFVGTGAEGVEDEAGQAG